MLLERTIEQLDRGPMPPEQAREMGDLGYLQWLGGLAVNSDYRREAMYAYTLAAPAIRRSPAVGVFCNLLVATTRAPATPLPMAIGQRRRRGGAQARRAAL